MEEQKDKDRIKSKTAVAISYDRQDSAPKIIATGKGYLADRIIERAKERNIPLHKDETLAGTLAKLELGSYIPPELYDVVAEILVFVGSMDDMIAQDT
ncbi:MAG TPA: flagellar biosynthesis protein FlhB [Lachnospiraceae bacterium]|jgi:flagellar biosynthesis protein|nr:flagellar biosynthesis protein FlhB [Lachnospiraceae bacterium]